MRPIILKLGLAALLASPLAIGCAEEEAQVQHPSTDEVMGALMSESRGEIVARVGETALSVEELQLFWERDPELSRAEAIDGLIEETLLQQEARRLMLHQRAEVTFARKQGLVNAFLAAEVEALVDEVEPETRFLSVIQQNADLPSGYRASHMAIVVPSKVPGEEQFGAERRQELLEERYEEARTWIEESAARLGDRPDLDALIEEAARLNQDQLPQGYQAVVNAHMRFPKPSEGDVSQRLPQGWIQVVPDFSKAADTLASDAPMGTLSGPVRSPVGWHLLKVDEVIASRPADPAAVERFAEHALTREKRAEAYTEQLTALLEGARVQMRPERLQDEGPGR